MTLTFPAIVEGGRLRPVGDVSLPEGTELIVTVTTSTPARTPRKPAELLAEIAALPVEGSPDADVSIAHDRELYGKATEK